MERSSIPIHLDATDLVVLRWIALAPREIADAPLGMQYSLASISRRRLLKLGLIHCDQNPPALALMYQITARGLEYLAGTTAKGGAA